MPKGQKGFVKGHKHTQDTKNKISLKLSKSIFYNCDYCDKISFDKPSSYKRKKRHFCSRECYSKYRKEFLPFNEQPSYKGVREVGDSKQIYHKNYCKKHPEIISHLKSRRYAREKNAIGFHTLKEWNELKLKYNNKCAICGLEKKLTKDHIIPLSKNGTDFIDNIQPLCKNCNSKKWAHI